jgi:hypothetical protein
LIDPEKHLMEIGFSRGVRCFEILAGHEVSLEVLEVIGQHI